jgi:dCMP deaminase
MSLLLVQRKCDGKYAPTKSYASKGWVDHPAKARFFKRGSDLTLYIKCSGLKREDYDIVELKFEQLTPPLPAKSPKSDTSYRVSKAMLHFGIRDWEDRWFRRIEDAHIYVNNFCHKYNIHKDYFKIIEDKQRKWDYRFIELAEFVSNWSKDPSTKTGAVIVGPDREIIGLGYNGFARGVNDSPERYNDRELKYKLVVHCERNAIIWADKSSLKGSTLYTWPFMSCSVCAGIVVQAGIKRCVAPSLPADKAERWAEDMKLATMQFKEAKVGLDIIPLEELK